MCDDVFIVQEPDTRVVLQPAAGQDYVYLDTNEVFIICLEIL